MKTLAEIKAAADLLSREEKQELFLFLAAGLHSDSGALPPQRDLTRAQIEAWITEDEDGMRRFREAS